MITVRRANHFEDKEQYEVPAVVQEKILSEDKVWLSVEVSVGGTTYTRGEVLSLISKLNKEVRGR